MRTWAYLVCGIERSDSRKLRDRWYFRSQGSSLAFRSQTAGSFGSRELLGRTSLSTHWAGAGSAPAASRVGGGKKGVNLEFSCGPRQIAMSSWERPGCERATPGRPNRPRDGGSQLRDREASASLEQLWLPGRLGCGRGHGESSAGEQRPPDCGGDNREDFASSRADPFLCTAPKGSRAQGFSGPCTPIPAAAGKCSASGSQAPAGRRASAHRVGGLPSAALPELLESAGPVGGSRCLGAPCQRGATACLRAWGLHAQLLAGRV